MKAIIMAGGYATRLWPITRTKAKPLLPLGKKKIIDYIYEKIKPFGFEIIVSTNLRFKDDFEKWAEDKDVKLVIENTTKEEEKLGAVRALYEVSKDIDDDILVLAGDNVFSFGIEKFIEKFKEKKPLIALYDVGDFDLAKRYGIAQLNGDRIVSFEEKPEKPKSTLAGIGIYALDYDTKEMLGDYVRGEKKDNLGDFISWLIDRKNVYGFVFEGNWYDVGNPDSYLEAFKIYLENYISDDVKLDKTSKIIEPVVIEDNVEIRKRSIIGPYVYIGRDCVIEASDISDSVIFSSVILKKVKLWRSIVDEKCEIRNLELSNSIVGGHAKIQRGE
uniref:NDP-sugar synthase n=1 Tax=Geoglobus ahangari TaxID=113653 RepID=A0A7C3YLE3_9EURY